MRTLFTATAARLKQEGVHFYALLAQANPQSSAPKQLSESPAKIAPSKSGAGQRKLSATTRADTLHIEIQVGRRPKVADQFAGTSTLIVPNETLKAFEATDFPMLIITDPDGIVRYIQPAPQNVLVEDGLIDQVAQRVLEQWPASSPR